MTWENSITYHIYNHMLYCSFFFHVGKLVSIALVLVWYCIAILEPWYCIGIVLLDKSQYCSALLHADGACIKCGWHVAEIWMTCGLLVDDMSMACGCHIDDMWMIRGWHVDDMWMKFGWHIDNIWRTCGWHV